MKGRYRMSVIGPHIQEQISSRELLEAFEEMQPRLIKMWRGGQGAIEELGKAYVECWSAIDKCGRKLKQLDALDAMEEGIE